MRIGSAALVALTTALILPGCDRSPPTEPTSTAPAPALPHAPEWFADVTAASGLHFTHLAGTNYFMPDQMGSGIALLDCDNDGRLDVYLVQNARSNAPARNALFLQQPDGTFRDASKGSGADLMGRGMGAYAGDVNNDGLTDLLVTEYGAVRLLLNTGEGRFQEVSQTSGLDNPRWAGPASFLDFDRDGWLDVVVGNYLDYDPTHICYDVAGRQDFCAPYAFGETVTRLWRNATTDAGATPRFEDRTETSGLTRAPGPALGIVCADFNGDAWPDIFCADDGRPNRLFINQRDGTFANEAALRGVAYNAMGATAANMGIAFGDADGDGLGDLFVTHLTEEFHSLWRQGPAGVFTDQIAASGLQRQVWRGTGFGTVLVDFDCDGANDVAFANGLVRRAVPGQTPVLEGVSPWWGRYAQRSQLFINTGRGQFRDASEANPALCGPALVGRSLAAGDLDGDGAPDLIAAGVGGPVRVLRNVAPDRGHWLRLRLVDPARGRRDAIGAEATVQAGAKRWWAVLQPASSYLASNDPTLHFGLGAATRVDPIEVLWPDGARETYPGGGADELRTLAKGEGNKVTQ